MVLKYLLLVVQKSSVSPVNRLLIYFILLISYQKGKRLFYLTVLEDTWTANIS